MLARAQDRLAAVARDLRARTVARLGAITLLVIVVGGWLLALVVAPTWFSDSFAIDFGIYMDAFHRYVGGGGWYQERQLHGPYPIELGDILYPPVLMVLLAPFSIVGPWPWAIIPAVVIAAVVWHHRPGAWAMAGIAICLAWPVTPAKFVFANPVIWGALAVALGTLWRWPAAFVVIKPTVIPFALLGVRRRSWWLAIGLLVLLSLPFLADTLLYPRVLLDAQTNPVDGRGGPLYSLQEYPLLLIPILAWLGGSRRNHKSSETETGGTSDR